MPCSVCAVPEAAAAPLVCGLSGERTAVPSGSYALRAMSDGLAMSENVILTVRTSVSARTRPTSLSLFPGGRVAIGNTNGAAGVEVLAIGSGRRERLIPGRDAEVPLPAGRALALSFTAAGSLAGVTRPFEVVPAAEPAVLIFAAPQSGAGHVVIRFAYPADAENAVSRDARVVLTGSEGRFEPAVVSNALGAQHHSVFYDVPAGRYAVAIESKLWTAPPVEMEVRSGELVLRDEPRPSPRPTLSVELEIDPAFEPEKRRISLYRCDPGEWTAAGRLDSVRCPRVGEEEDVESAVFPSLEARWHVLELGLGRRFLRHAVDLRPARDSVEKFPLAPTTVRGRLSRARRGIAADLLFENVDDRETFVASRADEAGAFAAALWPQGAWRVRVTPQRVDPADAAVFPVDAPRPGPLERHFDLPPTELSVRVVDEKTREPIPDAALAFLSFGTARFRATDSLGEVRLSALAPGHLEITAEADGYHSGQAAFEIEDSSAPQPFEIALSPFVIENAFAALLPSGMPASGARAFVGAAGSGSERERVSCDDEGICRLAERPAADDILLVVHPDAGVTALLAADALASRRVVLRASGGILRVRPIRGESSRDALLQISVTAGGVTLAPVWLDTLAFAIGRPARSAVFPGARSGFFLTGLPAGPAMVMISAAPREPTGAFGPPAAVGGAIAVDLPLPEAIEIELP